MKLKLNRKKTIRIKLKVKDIKNKNREKIKTGFPLKCVKRGKFLIYYFNKIDLSIASLFAARCIGQPIVEENHHSDEYHAVNDMYEWHPLLSSYDKSSNMRLHTLKTSKSPSELQQKEKEHNKSV